MPFLRFVSHPFFFPFPVIYHRAVSLLYIHCRYVFITFCHSFVTILPSDSHLLKLSQQLSYLRKKSFIYFLKFGISDSLCLVAQCREA